MAAGYTRVHRLLRLITLIQSREDYNAARLAETCGVSERTIYRDLTALADAGVPLHHDEERGGYRIRRDFFMPPVDLTLEESLALVCLAERAGGGGVPFMAPAARAMAKVRSGLPGPIREEIEQIADHVEIDLARSMPEDGVADAYRTVQQAITTRRALSCTYESPRSPEGVSRDEFLFRPYSLLFGQRAWYAVGHHDGHGALRCLKLSRFTRLLPAGVPYAIPDDFSLREYLGGAWRMIRGEVTHEIELHFDAAFAETVADTHWHDTQEVEWRPDGTILFRCRVDGLDEIVWWVLGMGPHCTVRRPHELAERVHELARGVAALYGDRPAETASPD